MSRWTCLGSFVCCGLALMFSTVRAGAPQAVTSEPAVAADDRVLESTLEIMTVATGERTVVRRAREHFEAPNYRLLSPASAAAGAEQ